jgi:hypothetical protein
MRRLGFGLLVVFNLLGLSLAWTARTRAETHPSGQVIDVRSEYTFGGEIIFRAAVQSDSPVAEVALLLRPEGQQVDTAVIPAFVESDGAVLAVYDLTQHPLRAFSEVFYQFRVTLSDGEVFTSAETSFFYEDNRFQWQTLDSDPFQVSWYTGDLAFAQEVLNVAQAGLLRAQSFLPANPPGAIKIYVYDNAQALQAALLLSGQSWVAGHADPDLEVFLVSLPPGPEQHLEMERQVPHELMHVLLYHAHPPAYDNYPAWLNEGLASITELYPNPDYQILLESAYQKDSLLPLASLCQVFPRDANGALLAYAESASFTRHLYRQFGTPGLEQLLAQYGAGLECERGVEQALGTTLVRLERQWRQDTFAENPWLAALEVLLPWLVLLVVVLAGPILITLGLLRKKPILAG